MPYLKWKKARLLGLTGQMFHHLPFIFTFSYAIGSVLWILLSDRLLATLVPAFEDYSRFQTYKGWFFVSVSPPSWVPHVISHPRLGCPMWSYTLFVGVPCGRSPPSWMPPVVFHPFF